MTEAEQFCNDLELLKLAAKAAGMHSESTYHGSLLMSWGKDQPKGKNFLQNGCQSGWMWNPLTDDGDALRLAVHLGICVSIDRTLGAETEAWAYSEMVGATTEDHGNDPYEATRRAIVKAAADLARTKEPKV